MKLWQRHLFNQLFKTYFFLLFCLISIYVVVDLSVHGVRFLSGSSATREIALYYFHSLSAYLDLFLSLTFLLALMRVLFDLNTHREILALQIAGLSKKKLLSPFFLFALFLSALCYINSQWFSPNAQDVADAFRDLHKEKKNKEKIHVFSISLQDDSELIYQSFNQEKKELFDVFWVRGAKNIWHMKTLDLDSLKGTFVNHFTRNEANQLQKSASYLSKDFPDLPWDDEAVLQRFVPFENRPLSLLLSQARVDSAEKPAIFSHLYYKLLAPLIPFFILLCIAPISMSFSRSRPFFLIAAASLFGFIALKVILDGMLILGENHVLPAFLAICGPLMIVFCFSLPSFVRMR